MLWFALLSIIAIIAIVLMRRKGRSHPVASLMELARADKASDGLTATPGGGWLLNLGAPFALSVSGMDRETAAHLREMLEDSFSDRPNRYMYVRVAQLIFDSRARVDQVDRYFAENGPPFRMELRRLTEGLGDDYIDDETRRRALRVLDVWLPQEPWILFEEAEPLTRAEEEIARRYGYVTLQLLGSGVQGADAADPLGSERMATFERMKVQGLAEDATTGGLEDVLGTLRMNELRALLRACGGPKVLRKDEAVLALRERPDLRELLGSVLPSHKFYRCTLPTAEEFGKVDLLKLARERDRALCVAQLLVETFHAATAEKLNNESWEGIARGVELLTAGSFECPYCERMGKRKGLASGEARPPFHLGCRCCTTAII